MKTIAIASGKGGTGKTTFAVNIAMYLSEIKRQKVVLSDLDVEEPNSKLFIDVDFKNSQVFSSIV
jgi:MinD superfamily P-loop ATPase